MHLCDVRSTQINLLYMTYLVPHTTTHVWVIGIWLNEWLKELWPSQQHIVLFMGVSLLYEEAA